MTANKTTIISRAINKRTELRGMVSKGAKAAFDKRIKSSSWGMIIGKPRTAMIAAFC